MLRPPEAQNPSQVVTATGQPAGGASPCMWRYLPLALLVSASVVALPVTIATVALPRGDVASTVSSMLISVAASVVIASVEAALWTRLARAHELTFAELTLWGWMRRYWAERQPALQWARNTRAGEAPPALDIHELERLSKLLQARDPYTHGHSMRVARHARRVAHKMRLPAEEVAKIRCAAVVHDVGKIYTPRSILRNPGRLTDAEFEVIKRHSADGARMLAAAGSPEIAAIVRHHHERIDGGGYPDGLAGQAIPLGARIIAVADTFDALTSSRPYRDAKTHRAALDVLSEEAGSQLDRDAVDAFLGEYSARRQVAGAALAAALPDRILAALQNAATTIGAGASGIASIAPAVGASGLLALSGLAHPVQASGVRNGHHRDAAAETRGVAAPAVLLGRGLHAGPAPAVAPLPPAHRDVAGRGGRRRKDHNRSVPNRPAGEARGPVEGGTQEAARQPAPTSGAGTAPKGSSQPHRKTPAPPPGEQATPAPAGNTTPPPEGTSTTPTPAPGLVAGASEAVASTGATALGSTAGTASSAATALTGTAEAVTGATTVPAGPEPSAESSESLSQPVGTATGTAGSMPSRLAKTGAGATPAPTGR